MRTHLILKDGDDEEENFGDDYSDEENSKFEAKIDYGGGGGDNNDGLDDFDDSH